MTPAILAAYKVHKPDPLHMLSRMGADLEKTDVTYKNTPLHWAVVKSNHAAISALIKIKVDLMALNKVSTINDQWIKI
jgi:ankyrin repeat protein